MNFAAAKAIAEAGLTGKTGASATSEMDDSLR
jgi:hypothetical protein